MRALQLEAWDEGCETRRRECVRGDPGLNRAEARSIRFRVLSVPETGLRLQCLMRARLMVKARQPCKGSQTRSRLGIDRPGQGQRVAALSMAFWYALPWP